MKQLFFKIIIFLGITFFIQQRLIKFFPEEWTFQKVYDLDRLQTLADKHPTIVYFGDSTLVHTGKTDPDETSQQFQLILKFPNLSISALGRNGNSMGVYLSQLQYLLNHNAKPQTIIVPINMRTFSPGWEPDPNVEILDRTFTYQYSHLPKYSVFFRPLNLYYFHRQDTKLKQRDYLPIIFNHQYQGTLKQINDDSTSPAFTKLKNNIGIKYLTPLSPHHSQLKDLKKITTICHDHNINLILYYVPIDYQFSQQYWGADFTNIIKNNQKIIKDTVNQPIIDLTFSLPSTAFDWAEYKTPNEHLNIPGRTFVANELAKAIESSK